MKSFKVYRTNAVLSLFNQGIAKIKRENTENRCGLTFELTTRAKLLYSFIFACFHRVIFAVKRKKNMKLIVSLQSDKQSLIIQIRTANTKTTIIKTAFSCCSH